MKRWPHVWTMNEIRSLPEFGGDVGWFYGLVRRPGGEVHLREILPGLGHARPFLRDLWPVSRVIRDIFRYKPPTPYNSTHSNADVYRFFASLNQQEGP